MWGCAKVPGGECHSVPRYLGRVSQYVPGVTISLHVSRVSVDCTNGDALSKGLPLYCKDA